MSVPAAPVARLHRTPPPLTPALDRYRELRGAGLPDEGVWQTRRTGNPLYAVLLACSRAVRVGRLAAVDPTLAGAQVDPARAERIGSAADRVERAAAAADSPDGRRVLAREVEQLASAYLRIEPDQVWRSSNGPKLVALSELVAERIAESLALLGIPQASYV